MGMMSNYLEQQLIKHIFRTGTFTKPTTLAIALCTAVPTDSDTGALTGKEVSDSGTNYVRKSLDPLDANWADVTAGDGTTSNIPDVTFDAATADWGTIVAMAVMDNVTVGAGNMLVYGTIADPKFIGTNDTARFQSGQLSFQIDN